MTFDSVFEAGWEIILEDAGAGLGGLGAGVGAGAVTVEWVEDD